MLDGQCVNCWIFRAIFQYWLLFSGPVNEHPSGRHLNILPIFGWEDDDDYYYGDHADHDHTVIAINDHDCDFDDKKE